MQTGKNVGMKLMDDSLIDLYEEGLITAQEASGRAVDRGTMRKTLGLA